ncbi:MAG: alpha/beta fold hydrolase [Hyphomicrobiaceae bacterium]
MRLDRWWRCAVVVVGLIPSVAMTAIGTEAGSAAANELSVGERGRLHARGSERTAQSSPDAKLHTVRVSGRNQPPVTLHVEDVGRGRTIVLLHGLGGSTYSWRRVVPELAQRFRVVSIDLRGHGQSEKPFDLHYSPVAQAELVRDALEKLNLRDVTLAGHSLGGLVALIAALQETPRRSRISRLALIAVPAYPQPVSTGVAFLQRPILPYVALSLVPPQIPITLALMTEAIGFNVVSDIDIDMYALPLFDAGARHALIESARQIEPQNATTIMQAYKTLRHPTAVIWCRDDTIVPLNSGKRLARDLRRATLTVLDDCNHATPEQRPHAVAKAIASVASR